jgi:predicted DNA-binding protein with PD1-like motif
MKSRLLNDDGQRTYALVFDPGDEVIAGLRTFAAENDLMASEFTAIGALKKATLGYFDFDINDYDRIPIDEQVEVLSLVGNVSSKDNRPKIHAHVVVAKRDGTAHGGHLLEGYVRPTLEVILTESPDYLVREIDEATGLALIDLDVAR